MAKRLSLRSPPAPRACKPQTSRRCKVEGRAGCLPARLFSLVDFAGAKEKPVARAIAPTSGLKTRGGVHRAKKRGSRYPLAAGGVPNWLPNGVLAPPPAVVDGI